MTVASLSAPSVTELSHLKATRVVLLPGDATRPRLTSGLAAGRISALQD